MDEEQLNQQLSTLRGLHWPAEPGWLPEGPGFWVLAALLIGLAVMGCWQWWRSRQAPCREALALLEDLYARVTAAPTEAQKQQFAAECRMLIKRFARQLYPSAKPDTLISQEWQDFLQERAAHTPVPEALTDALYQPHVDVEPAHLKHWVEHWILKQRFRRGRWRRSG